VRWSCVQRGLCGPTRGHTALAGTIDTFVTCLVYRRVALPVNGSALCPTFLWFKSRWGGRVKTKTKTGRPGRGRSAAEKPGCAVSFFIDRISKGVRDCDNTVTCADESRVMSHGYSCKGFQLPAVPLRSDTVILPTSEEWILPRNCFDLFPSSAVRSKCAGRNDLSELVE
jgi:hypothetical protein